MQRLSRVILYSKRQSKPVLFIPNSLYPSSLKSWSNCTNFRVCFNDQFCAGLPVGLPPAFSVSYHRIVRWAVLSLIEPMEIPKGHICQISGFSAPGTDSAYKASIAGVYDISRSKNASFGLSGIFAVTLRRL